MIVEHVHPSLWSVNISFVTSCINNISGHSWALQELKGSSKPGEIKSYSFHYNKSQHFVVFYDMPYMF